MLKFFKGILIAGVLALVASPAFAHFPHGTAGTAGNSPVVTPGASQPTYNAGTSDATHLRLTNVSMNSMTPTFHGSSGDPNYNSRTFGRWTGEPFALMTGTFQIGLIAQHPPTNAELKSGMYTNVSSVQVQCDGGSFSTITGPTVNNSAGGVIDWNFTVNDTTWTDGLHQCSARMIPTTGPDGIMEGPPASSLNVNVEPMASTNWMLIDSGTRGTAGHILTIPSGATFYNSHGGGNSGNISVGWSVSAFKVAAGTFIDGDSTHNNTSCAAETGSNCTGAGGAGTYHLTGPSQTVYGFVGAGNVGNGSGGSGTTLTLTGYTSGMLDAVAIFGPNIATGRTIDGTANFNSVSCMADTGSSCTGIGGAGLGTLHVSGAAQNAATGAIYSTAPGQFGNETSFYFLTNRNGTLPRAKVFVCQGTCNGATGSDSNGGTSGAPVATWLKAAALAVAADPTTNFKGKFGVTVCIMNSGSNFVYSGGTNVGVPQAWLGHVDFAAANSSLCGLGTDPGGERITNDVNTRNTLPNPGYVAWHNVAFDGSPDDFSIGDSVYYIADHVTQTKGIYGTNGMFGSGGYIVEESTSFFGGNGLCSGCAMIRGSTGKYSVTDGTHNTPVLINNTFDSVGGQPMTWVSAIYSTGTPLTLNSVTLPADVTAAGNTLSSIFVGSVVDFAPVPGVAGNCLTNVSTIASATSNTMTFTNNGLVNSGSCSNGTAVYVYGSNEDHADALQLTGVPFMDVMITGNTFNANYPTPGQAPFFESILMDGVLHQGNSYTKRGDDVEKALAVNGSNNNVTFSNNTWTGSGSFQLDAYVGGNTQTFFKDRCISGGTILPPATAGTNQQSVAATSNACYTTAP